MVRGGPGHRGRGGRGGHMKPRPPFIPHVPFDIILAEPAFPQVSPPKEDADKAYQDVSVFLSCQIEKLETTSFKALPVNSSRLLSRKTRILLRLKPNKQL